MWLSQGWTPAERAAFYSTPQGSQLIRYSWYLALEQPGSTMPFNADHLSRYGYLANDSPSNRDGLPLGFVQDLDRDWLGLTCAACHTNEIRSAGRTWRIDGAPTDADTFTFQNDLDRALAETAAAPTSDRFKRFAAKVNQRTPIAADQLYPQLKAFSEYFTKFHNSSRSEQQWGRARIDAFGMIFNRATGIDLNDWNNTAPPNAAVSVPFLWDTHWHDVVQWNGSAPNTLAFQRLGRNVGEVLGVFANTDIVNQRRPYLYFRTTARRANLLKIEHLLASLRSPQWPAELGRIDQQLANTGAGLYAEYCESCHALTPRDKPLGRMKVAMSDLSAIGTDPLMATNAKSRMANSGILNDVRMPPVTLKLGPIPQRLPSIDLTFRVVVGAILAPPNWSALRGAAAADERGLLADLKQDQDAAEVAGTANTRGDLLGDLRESAEELVQQMKQRTDALQYKARPLDGIWATGPYLHNGSVPNLAELLKPAKQRPMKFYVGTREFDPRNVGFTTLQMPGASEFDTSKPGNHNTGHEAYRPRGGGEPHVFTDAERMALVEYLKTL
jgi:mono/diheme cytochrome c family protein